VPILVRPVREQLEHDRIIRLLQAKYRRKFRVEMNPGDERTGSVKVGPLTLFPDLVLWDDAGRKPYAVVEVETSESVNHLEAMSQWANFVKSKSYLYLYVPAASVDAARRLVTDHDIELTELTSYMVVGDQIRFATVSKVQTPEPVLNVRPPQEKRQPGDKAAAATVDGIALEEEVIDFVEPIPPPAAEKVEKVEKIDKAAKSDRKNAEKVDKVEKVEKKVPETKIAAKAVVTKKPAEKVAEKLAERPTPRVASKAPAKTVEKSVAKPAAKAAPKAEKPGKRPIAVAKTAAKATPASPPRRPVEPPGRRTAAKAPAQPEKRPATTQRAAASRTATRAATRRAPVPAAKRVAARPGNGSAKTAASKAAPSGKPAQTRAAQKRK
jgi:hypothetical protein